MRPECSDHAQFLLCVDLALQSNGPLCKKWWQLGFCIILVGTLQSHTVSLVVKLGWVTGSYNRLFYVFFSSSYNDFLFSSSPVKETIVCKLYYNVSGFLYDNIPRLFKKKLLGHVKNAENCRKGIGDITRTGRYRCMWACRIKWKVYKHFSVNKIK